MDMFALEFFGIVFPDKKSPGMLSVNLNLYADTVCLYHDNRHSEDSDGAKLIAEGWVQGYLDNSDPVYRSPVDDLL